jgi:hypothetical protein
MISRLDVQGEIQIEPPLTEEELVALGVDPLWEVVRVRVERHPVRGMALMGDSANIALDVLIEQLRWVVSLMEQLTPGHTLLGALTVVDHDGTVWKLSAGTGTEVVAEPVPAVDGSVQT